jgi:hypothetical protein
MLVHETLSCERGLGARAANLEVRTVCPQNEGGANLDGARLRAMSLISKNPRVVRIGRIVQRQWPANT